MEGWNDHAVVCLGGGGGSPRLLRSLRRCLPEARFTAIVACTDTGRSTGIVRRALNIPAPGDLRHCLDTLAEDQSSWASLLEQRLTAPGHPDLDGVAIGNLLLGVLTQELGSLGDAGLALGRLLGLPIPVLPVSVENVHLGAVLSDSATVHGEVAVRRPGKAPIKSLFVEGQRDGVWPPVATALREATAIVIGPGSLWTSLGAILTVKGVRAAIDQSRASIIFVVNTTTQPGQTDGLDIIEHVAVIERMLGQPLHVAVVNSGKPPPSVAQELAADGLHLLEASNASVITIEARGTRVVLKDLLASADVRPVLWQKLDTAYHDMDRVAASIASLLPASPAVTGHIGDGRMADDIARLLRDER